MGKIDHYYTLATAKKKKKENCLIYQSFELFWREKIIAEWKQKKNINSDRKNTWTHLASGYG